MEFSEPRRSLVRLYPLAHALGEYPLHAAGEPVIYGIAAPRIGDRKLEEAIDNRVSIAETPEQFVLKPPR